MPGGEMLPHGFGGVERDLIKEALKVLDSLPGDGDRIPVPWPELPKPVVDEVAWQRSVIESVRVDDLFASQPYLSRDNVRKFIENPGQVSDGKRALPNVVLSHFDGKSVKIIVDGHHRLAALWLLGADHANTWFLEV